MLALSFAAIPAVGIEAFSETDFTRSERTAIAEAIAQMQPLPEAVTGQTGISSVPQAQPSTDGFAATLARSTVPPKQIRMWIRSP